MIRKMFFYVMPVAVLCIFSGNAGAEGMNGMLGRNSIQMGFNQYYYSYSEKLDDATIGLTGIKKYRGQPKSDEYGYTAGFNFNTTLYSRRIPLYGSFIFEAGTGSHTYDGVTQTMETIDTVMVYEPYEGSKNNNFLNVGVYAGPYFLFDRFLVGIQCGIEYHNWGRYFPQAGQSGISMSEHYVWYYAPLKLQTAFQPSTRTSIGCNVYYKFMYSGTMDMSFGILDLFFTKSDKPPANLGCKQGFMAEFPFQTNLSKWFSFECKPWFEYRPFGRSNVDTLRIADSSGVQKLPFLEPASGSFSIGCMASILFGSYGRVRRSPGSFQ